MSSLFEFLTSLLNFITGIFSGKKEDKKNLWSDILDCRSKLAIALAEGRITDVAVLRKELDSLMKQYSRSVRNDEKALKRAIRGGIKYAAFCIMAISAFTGCAHTKGKTQQQTLIIGERIHILQPGSKIDVPELMPPAKVWYLLDNIAIQQWLGIPVDYDQERKEPAKPQSWHRRDVITSADGKAKSVFDVCDGSATFKTYMYDFDKDKWVEAQPK